TVADEVMSTQWDRWVLESTHGTIFHLWNWLIAVRDYTKTTLYPLLLSRGTTPVAIYPVFLAKRGVFRVAYSPPPQAFLHYLGPAFIHYENLKQEKRESLYLGVQNAVSKFLFSDLHCTYVRVRTVPDLLDSRPFRWTGYRVEPMYTYRVDLSKGREVVYQRFDRKLRDSIRRADREGVTVEEGGKEDLIALRASLSYRFAQQGFRSRDASSYLLALMDHFYPINMKVYSAYYRGARVGGMVALAYKGGMALWIGVPKIQIPGISPNDLVQWRAIAWAADQGYAYYELMDGGDNERLRYFKAKYSPDLVIWYSASKFTHRAYRAVADLAIKGN
ncbi:MAG: GNAT family N-acetyltransferase, partial [Methanomicrobiales archaeon]|nr:GNAT family N-acetyltransferase [Methanomicrobiales archaeon]